MHHLFTIHSPSFHHPLPKLNLFNPHNEVQLTHTHEHTLQRNMTISIDIQTILYPFLYNAPSELTVYTPKAIQKTVEYVKTHPKFNKSDYKSCESLEDTQEEIFGIWWQVWGDDSSCYPIQGSLYDVLQDLVPNDAYSEMIHSSQRRYVDILEQVIYGLYENATPQDSKEIRTYIERRFYDLEQTNE